MPETTKKPANLVDVILDTAGQKGTGKWTSQAGLDLGVAIPQIAEAVFARSLSAIKEERLAAANHLQGPQSRFSGDRQTMLSICNCCLRCKDMFIRPGLSAAAGCCQRIQLAARLRPDRSALARRLHYQARFLGHINAAFKSDPALANLLLAPYFSNVVASAQTSWRETVKLAIDCGIPVPALSTALSYYDAYRCGRLPANLLQAQRDYFGAHTYERLDRPRGQFFHTNWTGRGGDTASTVY